MTKKKPKEDIVGMLDKLLPENDAVLPGFLRMATPIVEIQVGDRVRSYDFDTTRQCYVEGVVEEITEPMEGCRRYKVRVERDVMSDVEMPTTMPGSRVGGLVYPPLNGTPTLFGRVTNGVEKL